MSRRTLPKGIQRALEHHTIALAHPCPVCEGLGRTAAGWCSACGVTGLSPEGQRQAATIPPSKLARRAE